MNIVALTGSGISAASGIKTYRAAGSQWDEYANGIAHARSYGNHLPVLWQHWTAMGKAIDAADPNAAHIALAQVNAGIITQNVDGLHQEAGSGTVIELHGDMRSMRCLRCRQTSPLNLDTISPVCPNCGSARVRTNAVLFGESIPKKKYETGKKLVTDSHLVLVIGTSGQVYPARSLVDYAIGLGKETVLFDVAPWGDTPSFSSVILGECHQTVPAFLSGRK